MRPARPSARRTRPPGTVRQVGAVLALRVACVRGPARRRAAIGLALIPIVFLTAAVGGAFLPSGGVFNVALLMPTAWLFFLVGAALAAAAGSGGRAVLPREQSPAFPLSPAADHLGAVLLAPLNLSWLVQALGLVLLMSWVVGPHGSLVVALAMTALWLVTATVMAQAVGWLLEAVRTFTVGTWALRGVIVASGLVGTGLVAHTERLTDLLDRAPTRGLVIASVAAGQGRVGDGVPALLEMGGLVVASWLVGLWVYRWVQRQPPRAQVRVEARQYAGRPDPRSDLLACLRMDHAGVWRSTPLRRGLVALGAVPGVTAALAGPGWAVMAILPGLVTSGAGLLFGVNAFSLDGAGVVWRETLPGAPRTLLVARLLVVVEVCVAGAALSLGAAALRAQGDPTVAEVLAIVGALAVTTGQVVARCARWSLDRPYAASLRDARDQPAPPAAMAGYSARLALATTMTGILFWTLARVGDPFAVCAVAVGMTLWSLRGTEAAVRRWDDHLVRGRVVATVGGTPA